MRNKFKIHLISLFLLFLFAVQALKLPKALRVCHLDPDNAKCRQRAVTEALSFFANGSRQLGIPVLEPMLVSNIKIHGNGGQVNMDQEYQNLYVTGHTNTNVLKAEFRIDPKNCQVYMESLTPQMRLEGRYRFTGRIFVLPINGHGPANITLINLRAKHTLPCKLNGDYLEISEWKAEFNPENIIYDLPNLLDGNPELSKHILDVMQTNNLEVFESLRTDYEKTFGDIYAAIANQLFSRIKYKDIFLL